MLTAFTQRTGLAGEDILEVYFYFFNELAELLEGRIVCNLSLNTTELFGLYVVHLGALTEHIEELQQSLQLPTQDFTINPQTDNPNWPEETG